MRLAAALRSARARHAALQPPVGRDVDLCLGRTVAEVLACSGVVTPAGRVAGVAALQAHPDIAAVLNAATEFLATRFDAAEATAVLQAWLAA
ncbi:hypothetical protein [Methylorubrum thiocyanatum]|uniref:hypothetical protein n=1 Tax=Methylorubrum thiocyanatum TaxID=47958 RepID=UPI0035C79541